MNVSELSTMKNFSNSKNIYNKRMSSWMRNMISNLYNAVSAPVAATHDALRKKLDSVSGTVTLLYNRFKAKLGYGQTLKGIIEEQAMQDYVV